MKNNNYVGWEEWVSLTELNLPALLAKTDTGAENSA
ncbi:MAG: ATP-dependent zinc protease, partial [Gammaproteobacteria bacterium]|nr:ATP-dependent zinc protease [Gammaproteobacteria bacterium]